MLKKLLLPIGFILCSATAFAQSTLTATNFNPIVGDAFSVRICDTTGIVPGSAGTSILWDFSGLTPTSYDTGRCIPKSYGVGQSSFPSANIAVKGPSFVSHSTTYYNGTSTVLAQYGYYSASDTNMILTDPAEQLRYPFTFGNSYTDAYAGMIHFGPLTAHHNGSINVTCDGWGSLVLPSRVDMNVLRVHTTQTFTDSTNLFGTPVMKTYNISSYDWYKPDYHTALLTIQTVTEVGSLTPSSKLVAYADVKFNGIHDIDWKITELQLSPNPTSDMVNIKFNAATNETVKVTLHDIMGREVAVISEKQSKGAQDVTFSTKDFPKGMYFITLQTGSESVSRKLELQ